MDVLKKQKRNEYSYKELATVFWNLGECGVIHFYSKTCCLLISNQNLLHFRHLYVVIQRAMYENR